MNAEAKDPVLRLEDHEARNPGTLNLSTHCNQRCTYCAGYSITPLSESEIEARLTGTREITLQGGEPTLNPDLLRYVSLARSRGCQSVTLVTNGLRLAYPEFAHACVRAGIDRFFVAFPSHRPDVSAALTGVERALTLKVQGIRNLQRLGMGNRIRLLHVVVSQNAGDLDGFARFVGDELAFVEQTEFKLVQCFARSEVNWEMMPSMAELRRPLADALAFAKRRGLRLTVTGVPPCTYPEHHTRAMSHEMRRSGESPMTGMQSLPTCAGCRLAGSCLGARTDYLKIFGPSEIEAARSALDATSEIAFPPAPRRRPIARHLRLDPRAAYDELLQAVRMSRTDHALSALRAVLRVRGSEPGAALLAEPTHLVESGDSPGVGQRRPVHEFTDGFAVTFDGELRDRSLYYRDFAIPVHGSPELRSAQRLFAQDIGRLLARGDRLTLTKEALVIADVDRLVSYLFLDDPGACRLADPAAVRPPPRAG